MSTIRIPCSAPALCLATLSLLFATACKSAAREDPPLLARGVELSEDPAVAEGLEVALEGFLEELRGGDLSTRWVDRAEQQRNRFFYASLLRGAQGTRPLVLKSYPLDDATHAVTIALLPVESPLTSVRRIVELEAVARDDGPRGSTHRFRSRFRNRTRDLNTQTIDSVTFHTVGSLDRERAEAFARFKSTFEADTGFESGPLDYYCFPTLDALLKAYGLVHDASKCNDLRQDLGFLADDGRRYVTGTGDARYLFGYVRDALKLRAKDPQAVYAPYLNGIAAYYGGYSLSGDSMETLAEQLRDELERRPSLDFLVEFRKGRASSVQRHFTHYVLCAFLFRELQRQHGTQAALALLEVPDEDAFLAAVEELLDMRASTFHDRMVAMIQPTSG